MQAPEYAQPPRSRPSTRNRRAHARVRATAALEYLARVWRWKSKEVAFELNKGLTVNSVCVSPNVVTGSSDVDGFARVWRLDDGKFIIDTDSFVVHSVCVTPDSAHVVTGSQNCVLVWRLSDFAKVSTLVIIFF